MGPAQSRVVCPTAQTATTTAVEVYADTMRMLTFVHLAVTRCERSSSATLAPSSPPVSINTNTSASTTCCSKDDVLLGLCYRIDEGGDEGSNVQLLQAPTLQTDGGQIHCDHKWKFAAGALGRQRDRKVYYKTTTHGGKRRL